MVVAMPESVSMEVAIPNNDVAQCDTGIDKQVN